MVINMKRNTAGKKDKGRGGGIKAVKGSVRRAGLTKKVGPAGVRGQDLRWWPEHMGHRIVSSHGETVSPLKHLISRCHPYSIFTPTSRDAARVRELTFCSELP